MAMELVGEYRIPCYALSYLVNNDASGITDEDVNEIDSFIERENLNGCSIDVGEYNEFDTCPAFGLACSTNVVRFLRYYSGDVERKVRSDSYETYRIRVL